MTNKKFKPNEVIATIALLHGFSECQNTSWFEAAMLYSMNGFEVVMIDFKGFGFSSGPRAGGYIVQDSHEQIGVMLQRVRTDKPLFIQAHSMGCQNMQTFLIRNPQINVAGLIYSAPFFEFSSLNPVDTKKMILSRAIANVGEELVLNTLMQAQWISHDKHYWKKLNYFDGTSIPLISGGIALSFMEAITDVHDNQHKHTTPTLLLTGGKDKIVDNKGAREFHKNISTPADLKQIKLFYNSYHNIHKEPQYRKDYFGSVFEFITKVINHNSKTPSQLNWKPLPSFKVGRPDGCRQLPFKRIFALIFLAVYFGIGFVLFVLLKLFSKNRQLYSILRVIFCWPLVFKPIFDALKVQPAAPNSLLKRTM